jgi:hypothetical protein
VSTADDNDIIWFHTEFLFLVRLGGWVEAPD